MVYFYRIEDLPQAIEIGFTGEHNINTIQIDYSSWAEGMEHCYPSVVCVRPGETMEDAYIAATTYEHNVLSWPISSSDLGDTEGTGLAQVWLEDVENASINKSGRSAVFATVVRQSVDGGNVTPPQQAPWLEQMTLLKTQTIIAHDETMNAKTDVDAAMGTLNDAVTAAAGSASDAASSATSAQGYAGAASASAEAAAASASSVEDSATAAAASAIAASGSASDAADSATAAAGSATSAYGYQQTTAGYVNTVQAEAAAAQGWATGGSGGTPSATNNSKAYAMDSEAFAVGERGGVPVSDTDDTYHNNSKYYCEEAASIIQTAIQEATDAAVAEATEDAEDFAEDSESYAIGKRGGVDVGSSDPAYHNNSKYFSTQAASSATDANTAKTAAQAAQAAAEAAAQTDLVAWLEENITNPDSPPLDRTLASSSSAAPADMVGSLKAALSRDQSILSSNLMGVDVQQNLYPGAADWSGTWHNTDSVNMGISDVLFEGYPTVYSSQTWRRYNKAIPVVAGKTYTFEGWIKHATAGALFVVLYTENETTNPATITEGRFKQFNNSPANTWIKLSYTFTVSASGNIEPCLYSSAGAFYIAKYNLVEGSSVFSLKETLNGKASTQGLIPSQRHTKSITGNLMGIDVQENLYDGAADWTGFTASTSEINVSNEYFEGYPVVYSSQSWRKFYKNIPVVSGKTYTFECWLKQNTAGTAFIYLVQEATSAATVSPENYQFKNQPANTWVKLSLTFTCSASGNVAPYGLSTTGAFYVAKYYLAEGSEAFSLTNKLNEKATKEEISGVGDYVKYSFAGTDAEQYWNPRIEKPLASGTKVKFVFDSYNGGSTLSWVMLRGYNAQNEWEDLVLITTPTHGATAEFITTKAYSKLYVQFARASSITDSPTGSILLATDKDLGITNELLGMRKQRVYHVEKDGTGDFTSIVAAIAEACKYMDSIVYIGGGTFELFSDDEFGDDYADDVTSDSSTWGMVLKNRVHVIGTAQTLIKATNPHWNDSRSPSAPPSVEYFSVFNTGEHGCTIENVRIEDKGIRYSIHDDQGWAGDTPYINKFINCTFIHKNGMYNDCIGGGLGENCSVEIRGCYFEADTSRSARYAYYHANNHTGITDAKGSIVVADNYFANDGSFYLHKYGDSTEMTTALVTNNSFGSEPQVTTGEGAQNNMRMLAWNNVVRT